MYSKFAEFYNIRRSPSDFAKAIEEVENSLVKISIPSYYSQAKISFINPSLYEFVESQWRNNNEIQKIVIQNLSCLKQLSSIAGMIRANNLENLVIAENLRLSLYRIAGLVADNKNSRDAVSFASAILWSLKGQVKIEDKKKLLEQLLPSIRVAALSDDTEAKEIADVVKAVAYLIDLEGGDFEEILQELKSLMLEAAEEYNFVEIHTAYSNAIKEHIEHFTDDEAEKYKEVCLNYIKNASEDYNERTWDELEEYKDNFSDLLNSYGMYDSSYIEDVDDRILELEAQMAENADYEDSSANARTKDADATDGELDALFASLTDNRD